MRGLIKTYGLSSDLAQVVQMRENVAAVWALFGQPHMHSPKLSACMFTL